MILSKKSKSATQPLRFNFVLIGDTGVGKTCIQRQFISKTFEDCTPMTIGHEMVSCDISIEDMKIRLNIWDICGLFNYFSISVRYCKGACGIIIVYDIQRLCTFHNVIKWLREIRKIMHPNAVITLIGNKAEVNSTRNVSTEEGEALARKHGLLFVETSARNTTNINEAFIGTAELIYSRLKEGMFHINSYGQIEENPDGSKQLYYDFLFKLILIGDSAIGKSSLMFRFLEKRFDEEQLGTTTIDIGNRTIACSGKRVKLKILDSSGKPDHLAVIRFYYKTAAGALLVYDVTWRETFENLTEWLKDLRKYSKPNMVIMLVGNKSDKNTARQVTTEEGETFARENNLLFIETSAKADVNVDETFRMTSEEILSRIQKNTFDLTRGSALLMLRTNYDFTFKYIVVGNAGTGKSSLLIRLDEKRFKAKINATIGAEFKIHTMFLNDKTIRLSIFDTSGQKQYWPITRNCYKGAAAALLVYDITDLESFKRIPFWLEEIRTYSKPHIVIMLVGNKSDIEWKRKVTKKQGEMYARKNGLIFVETSAKSDENVEEVFTIAAAEIYERIQQGIFDISDETNGIKLGTQLPNKSKRSGCSC